MDIPSTNALQEGLEVVKKERKECSSWSDLPHALLKLIMKRLCVTAYLQKRAVCKSWKAAIDNAIANKRCPPLPELPILLLQSRKQCCLFNLSKERVFSPKIPLFGPKQVCIGSVEGWMIISEIVVNPTLCAIVFFLNPMTNARVKVPSELNFPTNSPLPTSVKLKVAASSAPNCPDCLVVVGFIDFLRFTYCRISDESWTMIEALEGIHFKGMEILDGKLYVLPDKVLNSILVYDLQGPSCTPLKSIRIAQLPSPLIAQKIGNTVRVSGTFSRSLATDVASGQVFLIHMSKGPFSKTEGVNGFIDPPRITAFDVFQLDMSSELHWVKVDSLGDRILCLTDIDSKVMSTTAALNGPQEVSRGNCICFCYTLLCPADPWRGFTFGVYSLADRSFKYYTLERSSFVNVPCGCWFIPSAW